MMDLLGLGYTFDPTDPSDGTADWDGDLLSNAFEYLSTKGSFLKDDTDDDGLDDMEEFILGTDPSDPLDPPATDPETDTGGSDDPPVSDPPADPGPTGDDDPPTVPEDPPIPGDDGNDDTGSGEENTDDDTTQWTLQDSDGDGLDNLWERINGLDPDSPEGAPSDALADPDNDGLVNIEEYRLGTRIRQADSDRDGLTDGEEVRGWSVATPEWQSEAEFGSNSEVVYHSEYDDASGTYYEWEEIVELPVPPMPHRTSDPRLADTDGDEYGDSWEADHGTDPRNPADPDDTAFFAHFGVDGNALDPFEDEDNDGLSNQEEIQNRTDPFLGDSDGDGVTDFVEVNGYEVWVDTSYYQTEIVSTGFDPETGEETFEEVQTRFDDGYLDYIYLDPTETDSDGDLLGDLWELIRGMDPLDPADGEVDVDDDGLTLGEETAAGSSDDEPDSDFDGLSDFAEVMQLTPIMEMLGLPPFDPTDIADGYADLDLDGLSNAKEFSVYGTDLVLTDTDGDGIGDHEEVLAGTDPLDPNDPVETDDSTTGPGEGSGTSSGGATINGVGLGAFGVPASGGSRNGGGGPINPGSNPNNPDPNHPGEVVIHVSERYGNFGHHGFSLKDASGEATITFKNFTFEAEYEETVTETIPVEGSDDRTETTEDFQKYILSGKGTADDDDPLGRPNKKFTIEEYESDHKTTMTTTKLEIIGSGDDRRTIEHPYTREHRIHQLGSGTYNTLDNSAWNIPADYARSVTVITNHPDYQDDDSLIETVQFVEAPNIPDNDEGDWSISGAPGSREATLTVEHERPVEHESTFKLTNEYPTEDFLEKAVNRALPTTYNYQAYGGVSGMDLSSARRGSEHLITRDRSTFHITVENPKGQIFTWTEYFMPGDDPRTEDDESENDSVVEKHVWIANSNKSPEYVVGKDTVGKGKFGTAVIGNLDLLPVDLKMEGVAEEDEETDENIVLINADNDNGSDWKADTQDTIPSTRDFEHGGNIGKDDEELKLVEVTAPDEDGIEVKIKISPSDKVKAWKGRDKTDEIAIGADGTLSFPNDEITDFYVEGIKVSDANGRITMTMEVTAGQQNKVADTIKFSVGPILENMKVTPSNHLNFDKVIDDQGYATFHAGKDRPGIYVKASINMRGLYAAAKINFIQIVLNSKRDISRSQESPSNRYKSTALPEPGNGWNFPVLDGKKESKVIYPKTGKNSELTEIWLTDSPVTNPPIAGFIFDDDGAAFLVDSVEWHDVFRTHTVIEFDDGSIFPLGWIEWEIDAEFTSTYVDENNDGKENFEERESNVKAGSKADIKEGGEFRKSHDVPAVLTPPYANDKLKLQPIVE